MTNFWWALGLVVGFAFGVEVGKASTEAKANTSACALSCARNGAGKRHTSDDTWCTCTSGLALKRDRSRLYIRVTK